MTSKTKLGAMEYRFAKIIWDNAPMTTRRMVELCEQELNWARTTTYTVLKKFCDKGMFQMERKMVTVLVSRDEFNAMRSEELVEDEIYEEPAPAIVLEDLDTEEVSITISG